MKITNEMRALFAIETFDTIRFKDSGTEAVVVSSQRFDCGMMFECVRTDNGRTAILKASEIELIEKHIGTREPFQISDDTIERTRNWREGELAAMKAGN